MQKLNEKKFLSIWECFNQASDTSDLVARLAKELVNTFDSADGCVFYLYDQAKQRLVGSTSFGYSKTDVHPSLTLTEGLPGLCLANQKPVLLTTTKAIERECIESLKTKTLKYYSLMRNGLPSAQSIIAAPMIISGHSVGVIVLEQFNAQHRKFNKIDLADLEVLAHWIGLMIEYLRLNSELKANKRSYRELFGKLLMSNEAERKRISREIHDEINHILLSVRISLEDIQAMLSPDLVGVKERLKMLHIHIGKAFDELHRLSFDLRPPELDELGLPEALRWYVNTLSNESGVPIQFDVQGVQFRKAAPIVETALLRITQEALTNVFKHARASSIWVRLNYTEQNIVLEIGDDGIGFDVTSIFSTQATTRNLGLLGLKERAAMCGGKLTIESKPGAGTKLKTFIPIKSYDWGTY